MPWREAGVGGDELERLEAALTFEDLPSREDVHEAACKLVPFATQYEPDAVMLVGALWFMPGAAHILVEFGWSVLCAFSQYESVELVDEDGSVTKTSVFRHLGFVDVTERTHPLAWAAQTGRSTEGSAKAQHALEKERAATKGRIVEWVGALDDADVGGVLLELLVTLDGRSEAGRPLDAGLAEQLAWYLSARMNTRSKSFEKMLGVVQKATDQTFEP